MLFKREMKEFLILLIVFQDCGLKNVHEKYMLLEFSSYFGFFPLTPVDIQ